MISLCICFLQEDIVDKVLILCFVLHYNCEKNFEFFFVPHISFFEVRRHYTYSLKNS